jgi:hypothetical protein
MANAKYSTEEQTCVDAANGVIDGGNTLMDACRAFKGEPAEFLKKVRTFLVKGELKVVSVRDLRNGNEAQKKAATLFDTLSSSFRRVKEEKRTPVEKATAEKASKKAKQKRTADAKAKVIASVAESPKAVIKFAEVQIAMLKQKEKAPYDLLKAIAAWQAVVVVYTAK